MHYNIIGTKTIVAVSLLAAGCTTNLPPAPRVINTSSAPDVGAPIEPVAPKYFVDDFVEALGPDLDDRLGLPVLARREGPGEFRRYDLKDCNLIVILYPDDLGRPRVAHLETVAKIAGEEKPDIDACLAAG